MLDRFTDRARHVLGLAREEAARSNLGFIDTQHLLLGLAREETGVGACVLRDAGLHVDVLRGAVAAFDRVEPPPIVNLGPHALGFGPDALKALKAAANTAELLRHDYVGTEHLLLGLLGGPTEGACRVDWCNATMALVGVSINLTRLRNAVLTKIGAPTATVDGWRELLTAAKEGQPDKLSVGDGSVDRRVRELVTWLLSDDPETLSIRHMDATAALLRDVADLAEANARRARMRKEFKT